MIVPLFALANAGDRDQRRLPLARLHLADHARASCVGYVIGKPVGIVGVSWLVTRLSRGRLRPPVGWAAVAGGGTIAGIGFTVSLLIASLAFHGTQLEEAKLGVLSAALIASSATWLLFRAPRCCRSGCGIRALLGTAELLIDLAVAGRPRARPHPRARGRARHARRVRRLRVPVLRPGRAGRSASCSPTSATSATSGATCR